MQRVVIWGLVLPGRLIYCIGCGLHGGFRDSSELKVPIAELLNKYFLLEFIISTQKSQKVTNVNFVAVEMLQSRLGDGALLSAHA